MTRGRSEHLSVLLLLAATLGVGCGGGNSRSGDGGYSTAASIASALNTKGVGCNDFTIDSSGELFTREQGSCTAHGERVTIRTFATANAQANWTKAAAQFGGVHVVGDRWAVSPDTQATAEQIKTAIGGTIR